VPSLRRRAGHRIVARGRRLLGRRLSGLHDPDDRVADPRPSRPRTRSTDGGATRTTSPPSGTATVATTSIPNAAGSRITGTRRPGRPEASSILGARCSMPTEMSPESSSPSSLGHRRRPDVGPQPRLQGLGELEELDDPVLRTRGTEPGTRRPSAPGDETSFRNGNGSMPSMLRVYPDGARCGRSGTFQGCHSKWSCGCSASPDSPT
jgi:hypothetical protein